MKRPFTIAALVGFAVGATAALTQTYLRQTDTHFVKTSKGIARIHTARDENDTPVRVLQLQGAYESATYLDENRYEPVFAYQQAFDHVFEGHLPSNEILMIGGGGYAWPKHVLSTKPEMQIAVVELDPSITTLARKWFYLDQLLEEIPDATDRLKLITADGRNYLEGTANRYAAIINDTFTGKDPALSLATIEALRIAKTSLLPGGIYATNVVSEQEGEDISFLRDVVTTLNEVFAHVVVIPCEDTSFGLEDNYLVLASDLAHSFSETLPYDDDFLHNVLRDNR